MKTAFKFADIHQIILALDGIKISAVRMEYYYKTGLIVPSIHPAKGCGSRNLYSFEDIVILRIYLWLTRKCQIQVKEIRKVLADIKHTIQHRNKSSNIFIYHGAYIEDKYLPITLEIDVHYFVETTQK